MIQYASCPHKVHLGENLPSGFYERYDSEIGQEAAQSSKTKIADTLSGAQVVLLIAGLGGSIGTGASPVIAQIAKEMGLVTICIAITPFRAEGKKRTETAERGVSRLLDFADVVMVFPNDRLCCTMPESPKTIATAYGQANARLIEWVQWVIKLIKEFENAINLEAVREALLRTGFIHSSACDGGQTQQGQVLYIYPPDNANGFEHFKTNLQERGEYDGRLEEGC